MHQTTTLLCLFLGLQSQIYQSPCHVAVSSISISDVQLIRLISTLHVLLLCYLNSRLQSSAGFSAHWHKESGHTKLWGEGGSVSPDYMQNFLIMDMWLLCLRFRWTSKCATISVQWVHYSQQEIRIGDLLDTAIEWPIQLSWETVNSKPVKHTVHMENETVTLSYFRLQISRVVCRSINQPWDVLGIGTLLWIMSIHVRRNAQETWTAMQ